MLAPPFRTKTTRKTISISTLGTILRERAPSHPPPYDGTLQCPVQGLYGAAIPTTLEYYVPYVTPQHLPIPRGNIVGTAAIIAEIVAPGDTGDTVPRTLTPDDTVATSI